ncbi:MAG: nucleotidyltransferase family protein [Rhodocyclaceae bacterium]|nr:nucleotidyltransferase family protein [Rhodocyclaceae bacterium]
MRAMILAAGRGERMRPLTDHCPKPLLAVGGKPLIVWHIERLAGAGFTQLVINHAHLGEQLEAALGTGERWGVRITYSPEPPGALETAGGIVQALPMLGCEPFLVVNGDIYCDWDPVGVALEAGKQAHLVLVPNPLHNLEGDFALQDRQVGSGNTAIGERLTFAGIGIYHPELFAGLSAGQPAKLAPLLRQAMARGQVSGERYDGRWVDVGTPRRLTELDAQLVSERTL